MAADCLAGDLDQPGKDRCTSSAPATGSAVTPPPGGCVPPTCRSAPKAAPWPPPGPRNPRTGRCGSRGRCGPCHSATGSASTCCGPRWRPQGSAPPGSTPWPPSSVSRSHGSLPLERPTGRSAAAPGQHGHRPPGRQGAQAGRESRLASPVVNGRGSLRATRGLGSKPGLVSRRGGPVPCL